MPRNDSNDFVSPDKIQVIMPYSDLVKMVDMAKNFEELTRYCKRMEDQYAAIRGMFSECLEKIKEIENYVRD